MQGFPADVRVSSIPVTELFVRWQQHQDERARDQLVELYLPMARQLARRYRGAREPLDDLEQVAALGLVKAIDRYDPERGTCFKSFAVPTILGELKRYFRDCGWAVHIPRGLQERAVKVEQASRTLAARTGRAPNSDALAEHLDLSVEEVWDAAAAAAAHHAVSFDTPKDDGEGSTATVGDSIGALDPGFERAEVGASVGQVCAGALSQRERHALALRYLADRTQSEIGDEIGISQMQVSRILRRAVDQLSDAVADTGPGRPEREAAGARMRRRASLRPDLFGQAL